MKSFLPYSRLVNLAFCSVFVLLMTGCQRDGWNEALEAEVRGYCAELSNTSYHIDTCCIDYVKTQVSGSDFAQRDRAQHYQQIDLVTAGYLQCSQAQYQQSEQKALDLLPEPRLVHDFNLVTAEGDGFSRTDLLGQWSLLFFGFTSCPDICPDTMAVLVRSMDEIKSALNAEKPQVVFISIDPNRDSGNKLAEYVSWFSEEFVGVTGSHDQLRSLSRNLGVEYSHDPANEENDFYNVEHSSNVMFVDPQGRVHGHLAPPLTSQDVTAALIELWRS